jgi:hypothetical protein
MHEACVKRETIVCLAPLPLKPRNADVAGSMNTFGRTGQQTSPQNERSKRKLLEFEGNAGESGLAWELRLPRS